ncbi:MAG TPA: nucleotide exchange factor GrpE [Solirubrobacteraceae bacterium]
MSDSNPLAEQGDERVADEHPGAQAPGSRPPADAPAVNGADAGRVADGAPAEEPVDEAAEIEGDLDELVRTAAQRDEYLALAQRTQADFENYRKRVAREAAAAQERGMSSLAKELLPALDNLDRALEEADAKGGSDALLDGVRLVRSELAGALARAGIESFSPVGEPFDPSLHEAVATAEQPPGGASSGTVVEVYQAGYRLGGAIMRPARVVVAA